MSNKAWSVCLVDMLVREDIRLRMNCSRLERGISQDGDPPVVPDSYQRANDRSLSSEDSLVIECR